MRPFLRCPNCDLLWREFGAATRRYLNLLARDASPIDEIRRVTEDRQRIRTAIEHHENAVHGSVVLEEYLA